MQEAPALKADALRFMQKQIEEGPHLQNVDVLQGTLPGIGLHGFPLPLKRWIWTYLD